MLNYKQTTACFDETSGCFGAAARIRTGDLILTKGRGGGARRRYIVIPAPPGLEKGLELFKAFLLCLVLSKFYA